MKNSAVKSLMEQQFNHIDADDISVECLAVVDGEYEFKVTIEDNDEGQGRDLRVFLKMEYIW